MFHMGTDVTQNPLVRILFVWNVCLFVGKKQMEGFKKNVRFFPFIQYPNSSLMAYIIHIKLTKGIK